MDTPLISVVMSTFNGERFLAEAIESILAQSFTKFEFIIINDGSTDGTPALLDEYQKRDARIRVCHQENRGLVDALNTGCQMARGQYIARMDADDISIRDRLEWQLEFMERNPDIAVLGGFVELIDAAGQSLGVRRNLLNDHEIRSSLPGACPFWHPTVLMRTEAFRSTGGYRKVVVDAEDHDLWLRMSEHSKLANLGEVVLRYRVHADQVSMRKCKRQALSSLAAQAAFLARSRGNPDPLDEVHEITPALLADLGVSKMEQDTAFASRYLWRIVRYSHGADVTGTCNLVKEMNEMLPWLEHAAVQRWVIADLRLLKAKLHWRQGNVLKAIANCAYAIWTRPMIAARPVKPLLRPFNRTRN
jgi:GT2 family glycosyltransferase